MHASHTVLENEIYVDVSLEYLMCSRCHDNEVELLNMQARSFKFVHFNVTRACWQFVLKVQLSFAFTFREIQQILKRRDAVKLCKLF